MTLKTEFRRIEAFIKDAQALPNEQGNLSQDQYLFQMDECDRLIETVKTFILYNKVLNKSKTYDHLNDLKYLPYKDKIEILLEVLYESKKEYIEEDASLRNSAIIKRDNPHYLITLASTPDDFYKRLIEEINILYDNEHYIPVNVLLRKLFENLTIDILRKKYTKKHIELFYNPSKGMYQSFAILLDNIKNNINDFKHIDPSFNESTVQRLDYYRKLGNNSAHSISIDISRKEIDDKKDDINYLIALLIRIYYNIS